MDIEKEMAADVAMGTPAEATKILSTVIGDISGAVALRMDADTVALIPWLELDS